MTFSGYYAIPSNNKIDILKDVTTKGASITFNVGNMKMTKRKWP